MMMNNTLAQLRDLKLAGMLQAVEEQLAGNASTTLSFEERLALMVDREVHHRGDKRRAALLKRAGLKYPQACIEDVDGRAGRGFERSALMSLALSRWVEDGMAVLVTGPTGSGKSWLACALGHAASRADRTVLYHRLPRLFSDLELARGDGRFDRLFRKIARVDLLILDDWGPDRLTATQRRDLMEIVEERYGRRSTVITSQLPVETWHEVIGEPTFADAILDRLVHNAHRLDLTGDSLRRPKPADQA